MTIRDVGSAAQRGASRLRFDRYVLDMDRGCLLLDGNEIALRPKTFAVLCHLVENSGRLVSKDDLFAAVWPNLAVTDDALVQSIGELRRAIGEDGQRLIRTVPRRGYRLESAVSAVGPGDPSAAEGTQDLPAPTAGAPAPKPAIPAQPAASFATALAGRRGLAALSVLILLAAGALWIGFGAGLKIPSIWSPGHQPTKSAGAGAKAVVAILPFLNEGNDPARAYFADGLTQDIINALGRFSSLTVMSWNAVLPYRDKPATPDQIARNLAVRYQIEGSVLQTGDRVRVVAQLVDANGRVLWSDRFEGALGDLFALQGRITAQIAGALAISVTEIEQRRVSAKPTESLEAYDYVLRARPALQHPARAAIVEARGLLRRAIEEDPSYAAAYAALAETFYIDVSMGWAESPATRLAQAEEMANKALSLDASEVRAHVILGRIDILYHHYEQAKAELDLAIAANPNNSLGLAGDGNILMWLGQTDAAIEKLELAQRIDPELNAMDGFALSLAYYVDQRYEPAIEQAKLNLRRTEAAYFSYAVLAAAYAELDRTEDAARAAAMVRTDPTFDPQAFGDKLLDPADLERLRDGFRKAGLYPDAANRSPLAN